VRRVVVMTRGAVAFAETDTAGHTAPVGNPEQVRVYESAPTSVIVNVADDPAATVCEFGDAVKLDNAPIETFKTVLPPSRSDPVSGGPKGATMM